MFIKCKMCGGDIEFTPRDTYGTCEYCGSTSTIPQAEDENKLNRYNRANHFRRQCEFDKAVAAYEKILEQDDTDAEAHWGAVISRYGIEYVEDPATKKRIPTCHRVQVASILADADYLAAVENAPDEASRDLYKQQAAEIAEIQKGILAISNNEKPYDVFICYKETDENNQRTHDSQWAQDVYYGLTEQGYKVFFSRITLEDKLGQQYEPYIFAALNSAKVMVVIGSKPEYFNAVWVKNEWIRYLALMAKDRKRLLIPCYRDMDPYDLPEELSSLQSQDMSKIGFMQDLLRGVKKVLDADEPKANPKVVERVVHEGSDAITAPGVQSLLKRAFMFLEDGDWNSADEYCEKVLDIDPENAHAYLGKLMAELRVKKEQELDKQAQPFDKQSNYQKAVRFGNAELKAKLAQDTQTILDRNEYNRQMECYTQACKALEDACTVAECAQVKAMLATLSRIKEAKAKAIKCDEKAESIRDNQYTNAANAMKAAGDSSSKWDEAKQKLAFTELNNYRDVAQLRAQAEKRYDECLAAEKEAQRQKEEKARREAEAAAAKKKRNTIIGILAAVIAVAVLLMVTKVFIPGNKYKEAEQLRADGKYAEAVAVFTELGEYSDSAAQIGATYYAEGEAKRTAQDWAGAVIAFENAGSYSDSATQIGVTYYAEGEAKRTAQDWAGAVTAFKSAGNFSDAATQASATYYAQGTALRDACNWAGAEEAFANAGSYSDAATQITETQYQHAQTLNAQKDYAGAVAIFITIKGYKDVDKLLVNDENIAAAAAAAAHEAAIAPYKQVGSYAAFGTYPQTRAGTDATAIEWLVLDYDAKNNRALLISRYALDCKQYNNTKYTDVTWETCTLRKWLNNDFISKAFSSQQQAAILTTNVDNSKSQGYHHYMNGGNNTQDKVFLLSYAEAWKYSDDARKCQPTAYAVKWIGYTNNGNCDWWLRSPSEPASHNSKVTDKGKLSASMVSNYVAVRPALWLNLSSDIF